MVGATLPFGLAQFAITNFSLLASRTKMKKKNNFRIRILFKTSDRYIFDKMNVHGNKDNGEEFAKMCMETVSIFSKRKKKTTQKIRFPPQNDWFSSPICGKLRKKNVKGTCLFD